MITAEEAERIGLVNRVVRLSVEENTITTTTPSSTTSQEQQEKQRAYELAKILNKKLIDECISIAKEISNNSFTAVKTSKMLINKGMDAILIQDCSWKFMVGHYVLHMMTDKK
jgi:3-hydroxypropionyl-coenzyme A dehydratase